MQFFQPETVQVLKNFVSQFQHCVGYERQVVNIIKEFAGGDDVGLVLNALLLKFENAFDTNFTTVLRGESRIIGVIHGMKVWIQLHSLVNWPRETYEPEDVIEVRVSDEKDGSPILTVGKTTAANWNHSTQRTLIAAALMVCWTNTQCKYCGQLIVNEGMCARCELRINAEKCHFCMSRCGRMEHKRLKRGRDEPKVHYHVVCKKRKRFMF